ncbi:4Fe-4S dicluster domain-containing protein [Anoxynatronum buryatiense]|uniref:Formate dehydrogenase iron-sulfur subunit n=1 Tax=Anoxynatronum buryatiense TaxID=489973 RepID=A0AA46AHZ9_9CLOT|nr:4Fe-4S dicluster domain-containing protein [Anoxynatronum buryatiense]SMP45375.1 formate dehydrogenase iron-sulfur subunit [Anoxynatronum buryatiense]
MSNQNEMTMLVDHSLCIGCEACTAVCKNIYDSDASIYNVTPLIFRTKISELNTGQYYSGSAAGSMRTVYKKNACLHCTEASCVMACPTRACHKNEDGLVVIDERLCISCNYCAKNCPYNAISYDRPAGAVNKCSLCDARIDQGLEPLCSTVCPTKAVQFGPRDTMIAHASQRVEDLKNQGYVSANLYGTTEFNGQRVLMILDEAPPAYGLPVNPQIPLSLRLWSALPLRPLVLAAVGAVVGFNFLHSRKYEQKAAEVRQKHAAAPYCYVIPGQDEDDDLEAMDRERESSDSSS